MSPQCYKNQSIAGYSTGKDYKKNVVVAPISDSGSQGVKHTLKGDGGRQPTTFVRARPKLRVVI